MMRGINTRNQWCALKRLTTNIPGRREGLICTHVADVKQPMWCQQAQNVTIAPKPAGANLDTPQLEVSLVWASHCVSLSTCIASLSAFFS